MKRFLASQRLTYLFLVTLFMAATGAAHAQDGRLGFVVGTVSVNGAAAKRGTPVSAGDEIKAAKGGTALVVMKDKTTLKVASDTTVKIKSYNFEEARPESGNIVVSLTRGTLRFISGLINKRKPGASSVVTPVATMGIRGSDGTFTYTPASGNFTVQFDRGSGVMSFFDSQGQTVASVPVSTGNRSTATRGQQTVQTTAAVPTAVTNAINNSRGADGTVDEAAAQAQIAQLDPVERMVFLAVAATQDNEDTGSLVAAVSGAVSGSGAAENAAGAVFVANLIDPNKVGDHTREALENVNAGSGGATSDDAREVVRASNEISNQDGQESFDTVVEMGLATKENEGQKAVTDFIGQQTTESETEDVQGNTPPPADQPADEQPDTPEEPETPATPQIDPPTTNTFNENTDSASQATTEDQQEVF